MRNCFRRSKATWAVGAAIAALAVLRPAGSSAHDVPNDLAIHAFVKPEGQRLRVVARVPLITLNPVGTALAEVDLPRRGPGYLELGKVDEPLREAALAIDRALELYENGRRLTNPSLVNVRVSLLSDPSFASYEAAVANITGPPLAPETEVYWNQGFFDAILEYPIQSDRSQFSIQPKVAQFAGRVLTVVRFLPPDGAVRPFDLHGDPGMVLLDPSWHQAAMRFVGSGFRHILDGIDHLLFLLCLVIPFRRFRSLIPVVTSFTVAHTITLIASAYNVAPGGAWFPLLIEFLIALSIVYMALENIVAANLRRRWVITFGFGLVHGFGFSFALRETLQFAGAHLLTSLLAFNVGVELGQIAVLALFIPALALAFRYAVAERLGVIILSVLVAHTGWHWMVERLTPLRQVEWPPLEILNAIRWVLIVSIVGMIGWFLLARRRGTVNTGEPAVDFKGNVRSAEGVE